MYWPSLLFNKSSDALSGCGSIPNTFLFLFVIPAIFKTDPFVSIDPKTVGRLVEISSNDGKKANKSLKIGVCGEHAGDPNSINFLNTLKIDYISCSPFRIPTARLAAAQSETKE